MIGLADSHRDGGAYDDDGGRDLASALHSFGIEPSAETTAIAEVWAEQWDAYMDDEASESPVGVTADSVLRGPLRARDQ